MVETVNDSPLIKHSLTPEQILDKAVGAFMKVIGDDKRITIELKKKNSQKIILIFLSNGINKND